MVGYFAKEDGFKMWEHTRCRLNAVENVVKIEASRLQEVEKFYEERQ